MRSLLIAACCLLCIEQSLRADDSAALPVVRTLVVPQDHPEEWPAGDWLEVSADEYTAFVDWLNQSDASTRVDAFGVAEYFGQFNGDDLIEGEATIRIPSGPTQSRLIPLGEFSTRLQSLIWEDETPAVWGTASNSNSYLWVDRERGHLTAEWMQKGQRYEGNIDDEHPQLIRFELQLPTAVSSRLRLSVPSTQLVRCTAGVISGMEAIPGSDLNEWTLECGTGSRIAFVIMDADTASLQAPWSADLVTVASARTDGLYFEADLTIESSIRLPAELNLRIPRDLSVTAVRTTSDTAIEFRVMGAGSRRTLRIILPQTDVQRSVVRIRGIMPLSTRRSMVFPYVTISGASGVTASWTLQVDRPLELKSISPQGLQQTTLSVAAQRESWNFSPLNEEPRLAFEVGYPETAITGRSWNLVDLASPVPQLVSVTELECSRGTLFGSEWTLPRDWSVVSVSSPDVLIATWNSDVDPEAQNQTLRVEYRDPVDAGDKVVIEIVARSPPWHVDETHPLPWIRYQHESLESRLSIRLPHDLQWRHNSSQLSESIDSEMQDAAAPPSVAQWLDSTVGIVEHWEILQADDTATCRLVDEVETADEDSRLELGGTPSSGEVSSDGAAGPRAQISAQSHIAGANRSHHMHRCRYVLQPHREFGFQFTFERTAELLNVFVDGRIVEPQLFEHGFQLPIAADVGEIQVEYLTPADTGVITSEEFPLPKSNVTPVIVEWEFLLPAERAVSTRPEGVTVTSFSGEPGLAQRMLGPLARESSDSMFGFSTITQQAMSPLRNGVGSFRASEPFTLLKDGTPHRSLLLVGAGNLSHVQLELWDVHVIRSASWTCLIGAFLCLLTLRRLAPRSWKYVFLFAVAVGFAVAWFGTPPVAIISGGFLMGAVLAITVPRRLVHPSRDHSVDQLQVSEHRTSVVVSGTVGILAAILLEQYVNRVAGDDALPASRPSYDVLIPMSSGDPATSVMLGARLQPLFESWRQNENAMPSCLLNSASYELSFSDDSLPLVSAVLDVFIRDSNVGEILLPFRDVVIVGSAEAQLNDQPASLVPASNGSGFVLMVPDAWEDLSISAFEEDANSIETESRRESQSYKAATILLTFRIRGNQEGVSIWSAGIPRISQTQIVLANEDVPRSEIAGAVDQTTVDATTVLPLQPASILQFARDGASISRRPPAMSVVSSIELGPELSSVSAAIQFQPRTPSNETLVVPVRLPAQAILRDVRPAGKVGLFVEQQQDGVILWLELRPADLPGMSIEIDYQLVTPVLSSGELRLPGLHYWYQQRAGSQQLRVTPRAGFQWGDRPRSSDGFVVVEPEVPEESDDALGSLVSPATVVVDVSDSQDTIWDLRPVVPTRHATISEHIETRTGHSKWAANVSMTSSSLPSFLYEFEVDPRVVVQSVSVLRDGADRLLRWRQDRDRLVVFVQGDQTGTHSIKIIGEFETTPSTSFRLPRFEITDAVVESRETTVTNLSALPVILNSPADRDRRIDPDEEFSLSIAASSQGSVFPATLRFEQVEGTVEVTETIWLMPAADGAWTIWQRFRFEDSAGSLSPQTVWTPPEWEHISANATGSTLREGSNAERSFIRLEAIDDSSVELNLLTRVVHTGISMPVATLDVKPTATTLLLPRSIAIRSPEWQTVTETVAAAVEAPEGFSQISDWVAYQPTTPGAMLPTLPDAASASKLEIIRWETDIFCSSQSIIGESRIDLLTGEQTVLPIRSPSNATILEISVNGTIVVWDEHELTIPLPKESSAAIVRIVWTANPDAGDARLSIEDIVPRPTQDILPRLDLCCWNQGGSNVWLPRGATTISANALWLKRWEGLYVIAERMGASATRDLSLVRRILQCETALSRLPASATSDSDDVTLLRERWETLRQSWPEFDVLAVSVESASLPTLWSSWDADLGSSSSVQIYEVPMGEDEPVELKVAPAVDVSRRFLVGAAMTALIVLFGIWGLRRTTRHAWDDRLARHPRIAWLMLGTVWWLFFSPSILGALIVVMVITFALYRGARRLMLHSSVKNSPATASSHGH